MDKIHEMADANTIMGTPVQVDGGVTIIPVSKVSYGFAGGGSDLPSKTDKELFGGASGAGVTADMPEGAVAEVTADADGAVTGNLQAAQKNDSMDEKQRSQPAVSGNEASGAEDSMEEAEQDQEETLIEKQNSPSLEKMKTKGQQ